LIEFDTIGYSQIGSIICVWIGSRFYGAYKIGQSTRFLTWSLDPATNLMTPMNSSQRLSIGITKFYHIAQRAIDAPPGKGYN
jgi:hypothetical protein